MAYVSAETVAKVDPRHAVAAVDALNRLLLQWQMDHYNQSSYNSVEITVKSTGMDSASFGSA